MVYSTFSFLIAPPGHRYESGFRTKIYTLVLFRRLSFILLISFQQAVKRSQQIKTERNKIQDSCFEGLSCLNQHGVIYYSLTMKREQISKTSEFIF
jgi:hypothetical protein